MTDIHTIMNPQKLSQKFPSKKTAKKPHLWDFLENPIGKNIMAAMPSR